MYISTKNKVIQAYNTSERECRMESKRFDLLEYNAWITTITTKDDNDYDVVTYPSEDFTIVECTDEDVQARLVQLDDYISSSPEGTTYNIKYYASKRNAEEIKDIDGNSHDPKQYVQSHFVGDDTAKTARLLAEEWTQIRRQRTRLLAETDHLALSDQTLSVGMTTYRQELRDLPSDQSSETTYADITWPEK